jgi:hypothetical protein
LITFKFKNMVTSTRLNWQMAGKSFLQNSSIKKPKRLLRALVITLSLFIVQFLQPTIASGQGNFCAGNCVSGDIRITKAEIVNTSGGALPAICDEVASIPVKLKITFTVISQTRYGFLVTADLYIDGDYVKTIRECSRNTYTKGAGKEFLFQEELAWTCGKKIELRNVFTAWDNAAPIKGNTSICDRVNTDGTLNCSIITPKCYYYGASAEDAIDVLTPVQSGITVTYGGCTDVNGNPVVYKTITFSASGSGGTSPYSFNWVVKEGTTTVATHATSSNTTSSFSYTPASTNTLTVQLVVTDNSTPQKTQTYTNSSVTVQTCCTYPVISNKTLSAICSGSSASLSTFSQTDVTPTSTTYSWSAPTVEGITNETSGTNASSFSTGNLTNTTNAPITVTYSVTPKSGACIGQSFDVSVTVNPILTAGVSIEALPGGAICQGTSVTFTATPVNGGTPSYIWKKNGVTVNGVTGDSYTTSGLANNDKITVEMTSTASPCLTGSPATSNEITMTVNPPLPANVSIEAVPSGAICQGTSVTFTASPTNGGNAPAYQWTKNGVEITNATGVTYTASDLANGDIIRVVMTSNASPCLTGSPATSNGITMAVNPPLPASVSISSNATDNTICSDASITFTASPTNGGNAPTYQWKKNNNNIQGATGTTFTSDELVDGDVITVVMTSNASPCLSGSPATATPITVTVNPVPVAVPVVTEEPSCSSSWVTIEVRKNATETFGVGYKYSYDGGNTWIVSNTYKFKAGAGYNVMVKSPSNCISEAVVCEGETEETTAHSGVNNNEALQVTKPLDINARIGGATKVLAAPNPFTDKVRFTLQSEVSGQGSLEIYNTVGQKIATVYQGFVEAGKQLVKEYHVPVSQRANLIYEFRVGSQKTTGKLLNW